MTRYLRNDATLSSEVGNDFVALDVERGECFGMADVTADVWRLLDQPRSIDDLCHELQASYDVDDSRCRQDVADLLEQMLDKGLVKPLSFR